MSASSKQHTSSSVREEERTRRARQRANAHPTRAPSSSGVAATGASSVHDQAAAEAEAEMEAELAAHDLDEVIGIPLRVAFTEWRETQEEGWDGQPVTRRIPVPRFANLNTFVATQIVAEHSQLVNRITRGEASEQEQQAITQELVLKAWQQYEPEMTAERLMHGISPAQYGKLVTTFFPTRASRRQNSNPRNAVSTTPDSELATPATAEAD